MSYWVAGGIIVSAGVNYVTSKNASDSASATSRELSQASLDEQARQFDLQREDSAGTREAGDFSRNMLRRELGMYTDAYGAGEGSQIGETNLPEFNYEGTDPNFNYDEQRTEFSDRSTDPNFNFDGQNPEFNYAGSRPAGETLSTFDNRDRFKFDLESDAGYQFARDEGIKATNREMAAGGKFNSGNRLAAISDRVTGIASQYANDAYNRQIGESTTNYGRGVGEYGLDVNRNQDIYSRQVSTEASKYGRTLDEYGRDIYQDETAYGRSEADYGRQADQAGIDYSKSGDDYNRGINREGIDYGLAQDTYGRDLNAEALDYNRNLTDYGLDYTRETDIYGQDQNYLNRLAAMAGQGQTANQTSAAAGSNMANAVANINSSNARNQINATNTRYEGINNAVQGGISNYLTYQEANRTPAYNPVPGDADQPYRYYQGTR